jgi:hypothetical protein
MTPSSSSPFFLKFVLAPHFIFHSHILSAEQHMSNSPSIITQTATLSLKRFHSQKLAKEVQDKNFCNYNNCFIFSLKNLVRLSLSVRHVARLLLAVLYLGYPAAELHGPLRLPCCRRQAEMVRSQSDQDGLCQGDFKIGA